MPVQECSAHAPHPLQGWPSATLDRRSFGILYSPDANGIKDAISVFSKQKKKTKITNQQQKNFTTS